MVENLWGIETLEQISRPDVPKRILAEQASLLQKITNGLLYAEVDVTSKLENGLRGSIKLGKSEYNCEFNYQFSVCAPALGDFHHKVFSIHHDINLYPCFIMFGDKIDPCKSESDLRVSVRTILTSQHVKTLIASLVAQSAA